MKSKGHPLDGIRYVDDIEYSFATLADAERALLTLEGELFELQLRLNPGKSPDCRHGWSGGPKPATPAFTRSDFTVRTLASHCPNRPDRSSR
jgi:hypothetical protein